MMKNTQKSTKNAATTKTSQNLQDLLENIKSPFQEEKQKSVLTKEVPSIMWFNISIVRGNNKYAGFTRKYIF